MGPDAPCWDHEEAGLSAVTDSNGDNCKGAGFHKRKPAPINYCTVVAGRRAVSRPPSL